MEALRYAYDTDEIACGGAFVVLNHNGKVRVERGFIHPEDDNRLEKVRGRGSEQEDDEDSSACADDEDEPEADLSDNLLPISAHRRAIRATGRRAGCPHACAVGPDVLSKCRGQRPRYSSGRSVLGQSCGPH